MNHGSKDTQNTGALEVAQYVLRKFSLYKQNTHIYRGQQMESDGTF